MTSGPCLTDTPIWSDWVPLEALSAKVGRVARGPFVLFDCPSGAYVKPSFGGLEALITHILVRGLDFEG